MKIQLLPFHPEDLEEICSLEKKNFSELSAISSEQLSAIILHSDVFCYCLKKETNEIIAYIILKIEKLEHKMIILSLAVQKKYRKKNWGSKLIDLSKKISQNLRLDSIHTQLEDDNQAAKKFLETTNFEVSNKFEDYLKKGQKGLEMSYFFQE